MAGTVTGRALEAYTYIEDRLIAGAGSPTITEIGTHLGVSKTRASALVEKLEALQLITRPPGSQRGITIPGLARDLAVAILRREGWHVNEDALALARASPNVHVPIAAILPHDASDDA